MKHIYLIDYENTQRNIMTPLLEIAPKDSWYYLFYSTQTSDPSYTLKTMPDQPIAIKFINCLTGTHDAMDFRIVATATRMATQYPNAWYYIVSNDIGYDSAIQYLQEEGIRIFRMVPPVTKLITQESKDATTDTDANAERDTLKKKYRSALNRALKSQGRPQPEADRLRTALVYTTNLQKIHRAVQLQYKGRLSKFTPFIYAAIKKELQAENLISA